MRECLGDLFVIALFIILAVNFSMLWLHGGVYFIYEYNKAILIGETIMTAGIGVIGIERLIDDLRKK
jgi:hypothetical protein